MKILSFAPALLLLTSLGSTPAHADANTLAALKKEQAIAEAARNKVEAEIERLEEELETIKETVPAATGDDRCDTCAMIANKNCGQNGAASAVAVEPMVDVCFRIFQNSKCYSGLSATMRGKIDKCWMVKRAQDSARVAGQLMAKRDERTELDSRILYIKEDIVRNKGVLNMGLPECEPIKRDLDSNAAQTAAARTMRNKTKRTEELARLKRAHDDLVTNYTYCLYAAGYKIEDSINDKPVPNTTGDWRWRKKFYGAKAPK